MAIENILKRKIARELQEWIFLGIDDGMIRSAQEYKSLIAQGRTSEAEGRLSRAVDMPFRALARIEAMEAQYTTVFIEDCLKLYGDCTLQELKDAIIEKQKYAKERALEFIDSKIDNVTIADNITASISSNAQKWVAPIPSGYKEITVIESEKLAEVKG